MSLLRIMYAGFDLPYQQTKPKESVFLSECCDLFALWSSLLTSVVERNAVVRWYVLLSDHI